MRLGPPGFTVERTGLRTDKFLAPFNVAVTSAVMVNGRFSSLGFARPAPHRGCRIGVRQDEGVGWAPDQNRGRRVVVRRRPGPARARPPWAPTRDARTRGRVSECALPAPHRGCRIGASGLLNLLRLRPYEDAAAVFDVDVQVEPMQQRHPNEGRRIGHVGNDLSWLAVP